MLQNLQTFVKFQKFQLENLVDFEKCCKTHIFLQKIGADTAENERNVAEILPKIGNYPTGPPPAEAPGEEWPSTRARACGLPAFFEAR